MKIKKILLFLLIAVVFSNVYAKGSIELSENNVTMNIGETKEFKIKADNLAGVVSIKSSNSDVASIDQNEYFFDTSSEDSELVVKVQGLKEGKTNIEVSLDDVTTYDEEELTGTKILSVTVNDNNSNNSYYIIGGIVLLLIVGVIYLMRRNKKYNV